MESNIVWQLPHEMMIIRNIFKTSVQGSCLHNHCPITFAINYNKNPLQKVLEQLFLSYFLGRLQTAVWVKNRFLLMQWFFFVASFLTTTILLFSKNRFTIQRTSKSQNIMTQSGKSGFT